MIKVKEIALSRLLKIEVRALLEDVILILEKHNPETYRLQDLYEILLDQTAKVQIFTQPYGEHASTYFMNQFHKKRLKCASSISMQVEALEKTEIEEIQQMAIIARRLSKEHLIYLGRKNRFDVDRSLNQFFRNLDSSFYAEDRDAFIGLGLQRYMDELKEAHKLYLYHSNERRIDIENRPPTGDRMLQRESQKKLGLFFDQVNSFQETFKEIDYTPLISSLNVELTACSKSINTRIATNKRKARKKAAAAKKLASEKNSDSDKNKTSETTQSAEPTESKETPPINEQKDVDDITTTPINKQKGDINKDSDSKDSKDSKPKETP